MTESSCRQLACAKRWAARLPREQFRPGKEKAKRRMLRALFSILPPKTDGTHPLDEFKLEG
jgi:hypothetical protein